MRSFSLFSWEMFEFLREKEVIQNFVGLSVWRIISRLKFVMSCWACLCVVVRKDMQFCRFLFWSKIKKKRKRRNGRERKNMKERTSRNSGVFVLLVNVSIRLVTAFCWEKEKGARERESERILCVWTWSKEFENLLDSLKCLESFERICFRKDEDYVWKDNFRT